MLCDIKLTNSVMAEKIRFAMPKHNVQEHPTTVKRYDFSISKKIVLKQMFWHFVVHRKTCFHTSKKNSYLEARMQADKEWMIGRRFKYGFFRLHPVNVLKKQGIIFRPKSRNHTIFLLINFYFSHRRKYWSYQMKNKKSEKFNVDHQNISIR